MCSVTPSPELAAETIRLVADGLRSVANTARAVRAVARNGAVLLVGAAVNELRAERVEVITGAPARRRRIVGGAVFVGPWAWRSSALGPNHVLPTGGAARFASPLSVRHFQRRRHVVTLTRDGLAVTEDVVRVAMAEGYQAEGGDEAASPRQAGRARRMPAYTLALREAPVKDPEREPVGPRAVKRRVVETALRRP